MAATAYASLVSLLNTLDHIHTHPLVSTFFDNNQNNYLSEKVLFLADFVEKYSDAESREVEDLVRRIANAAHEAEDMIEVYVADRVRGRESPSIFPDLQIIIEEMESINKEVIKAKEECFTSMPPPSTTSSSSSSTPPANDEATTMVGFDDYKHKLLDDLIGHDVDRQIITITGMGGIGKTTLARNLYENSLTVRHFNVRLWITVSQDSSARKVYLQALSCLGGGSIDMDTSSDQQLSLELHQSLFNQRYLIVLDDVWSVEIWDKIKFYFPENENKSRIIVTTRESKLIDYFGSSTIAVKFLDEENSWKLFSEKTFPKQGFPSKLEEVGKKIVKKCEGLPLAISVIGGLLGKSPGTQEYWEKVAEDKGLILNWEENKPSNILYLSYKYLPVYLKPCFVHLGFISDIDVFELIKRWVAEGFIKANRGQSLEEAAESHFNDLVDRNLLLVHPLSSRDWKMCFTHDLCIEIGEKENFFYVQRSMDGNRHFLSDQTTARFYPQECHALETPSILHPLIVPRKRGAAPFRIRLLRVFYSDYQSPYYDALEEVNMRYLQDDSSREHDFLLPSLVSRLWSLQTLIIVGTRKEVVAPTEIWKMPQLRHIDIVRLYLPPPHSDDEVFVLQNLQTLQIVGNLIFTEEVCKRIPNIKKLDIYYEFSQSKVGLYYHLDNLGCFNKLESLHYSCNYEGDSLQNTIKFPSSLKELILSDCKLEWSYMAAIASLPHLQFLHLRENAVAATEWVFCDEKFVSLKHMIIFHCGDVTKWIAQSPNFPVLEKLLVSGFTQLDEIPSSIGEIPTLRLISLSYCSESAYISAVEILHEQEKFANLGLKLEIDFPYRSDEATSFKEKIQELGLTCQNLVIKWDRT